jgi:hypothetical protein
MILEHPPTPTAPEVETPADHLECLPWQLETLIRAAINGSLPTSTPITQGLIPDLNVFVISWACAYLLRGPDALKRLWEARRAWDWYLNRVSK